MEKIDKDSNLDSQEKKSALDNIKSLIRGILNTKSKDKDPVDLKAHAFRDYTEKELDFLASMFNCSKDVFKPFNDSEPHLSTEELFNLVEKSNFGFKRKSCGWVCYIQNYG